VGVNGKNYIGEECTVKSYGIAKRKVFTDGKGTARCQDDSVNNLTGGKEAKARIFTERERLLRKQYNCESVC
jgi:hypothetical protein